MTRLLRGLAFVSLMVGCGRTSTDIFDLDDDSPLAEFSTAEPEPPATPPDEDPLGCEEPACRELAWACPGPDTDECCDGLPCIETVDYGWTCGGAIASGDDVGCPPDPARGTGCEWLALTGCENYGRIANVCPSGGTPVTLRRCDGTCVAPNEHYVSHYLCSCESREEPCEAAPCRCRGATWDAVLCC